MHVTRVSPFATTFLFKGASLVTVFMGSTVFTMGAVQAQGACNFVGGVQVCTGQLTDGIVAHEDAGKLVVEALSGDIAPESGIRGITFDGFGGAALISDLGSYAIRAVNADGIRVTGTEDVEVDHTGAITAGRDGIVASSVETGKVHVFSSGDVVAGRNGFTLSSESGTVFARHLGDVTARESGFYLRSSSLSSIIGYIGVEGSGDITAGGAGIDVQTDMGYRGAVSWTGDITSGGQAVSVITGTGAAASFTAGNITAVTGGILVRGGNSAGGQYNAIAVAEHIGGLTVTQGNGIEAHSLGSTWSGVAGAKINGTLQASGHGLVVTVDGAWHATATQQGKLVAGGNGIDARSGSGGVTVWTHGQVVAGQDGVSAQSGDQRPNVSIIQDSGSITGGRHGIHGVSLVADGDAPVLQDGVNVRAAGDLVEGVTGDAIRVLGYGGAAVNVRSSATLRAGQNGITAIADVGKASIDTTSDIFAGGTGILLSSNRREATLRGTGNIIAGGRGIDISTRASGEFYYERNVAAVFSGNITAGTEGVVATSVNGGVVLRGAGTITSGGDAVRLHGGTVENDTWSGRNSVLMWEGDITSHNGSGARVIADGFAAVVRTSGNLSAGRDGIFVQSAGPLWRGQTVVEHIGDVSAREGVGITARNTDDAKSTLVNTGARVAVTHIGALQAGSHGIVAEGMGEGVGEGRVTVYHSGTLQAGGHGISATSTTGVAHVTNDGPIVAGGSGVIVRNTGAEVASLVNNGVIVAGGAYGIEMGSRTGAVSLATEGAYIHAENGTAVSAINTGIDGDTGDTGAVSETDTVSVDVMADLVAGGNGIFAQSKYAGVYVDHTGAITAGGDGIVAQNDGAKGISIRQTGDVTAAGTALSAASRTGDIGVALLGGTASGGTYGASLASQGILSTIIDSGAILSGDSVALHLRNGSEININNAGTIRSVDPAGHAVLAVTDPGASQGAMTNFLNTGVVAGNIVLNTAEAEIYNAQNALLETDRILHLGTSGRLDSAGSLTIGRNTAPVTTVMTGDLVTQASGRMSYDLDMANARADRLEVSGTASLAGEIALTFQSVSAQAVGFDLLTAAGGATASGMWIRDNAFLTTSHSLSEDALTLRVDVSGVDFAVEGLDARANAVAGYLNRATAAGGEGTEAIASLIVNAGTADMAQEVFDALDSTVAIDAEVAAAQTVRAFADGMMSCRVPSGLMAPISEGACTWTRVDYTDSTRGSAAGGEAHSHAMNFTYGTQKAWGSNDLHIGAGFGVTFAEMTNDAGATARGDRFNLGVTAKYSPGPYMLAAGLTGSWGADDLTRRAEVGGETQILTAEAGMEVYGLKLRGAYLLGGDRLYLMPQVDLDTTYTVAHTYRESGGSGSAQVAGWRDTRMTLTPAVELGTTLRAADGGVTRIYGRIGTQFVDDASRSLATAIAGDATGVEGFAVTHSGDDRLWSLSTGVTVFDLGGWSAEARLDWTVGEEIDDRQAGFKIRRAF